MGLFEFHEDVSPPTQEASSVPADCWGDVPDPHLCLTMQFNREPSFSPTSIFPGPHLSSNPECPLSSVGWTSFRVLKGVY